MGSQVMKMTGMVTLITRTVMRMMIGLWKTSGTLVTSSNSC